MFSRYLTGATASQLVIIIMGIAIQDLETDKSRSTLPTTSFPAGSSPYSSLLLIRVSIYLLLFFYILIFKVLKNTLNPQT